MCLGIPGKVIALVKGSDITALVDIAGVQRVVDMTCVIPVGGRVSDVLEQWVLVHVGFAMMILDEEEARKTLVILQELGEVEEELSVMKKMNE
jgi:hydrogenase expression/formation protein HypC